MRKITLACFVLITAVSTLGVAHADCKKPRTMVLLDKSSSMITGNVGNDTKWAVAKAALDQVLKTYEGVIDFGLLVFPDPKECGPGAVKVPMGPNNAQAIMNELSVPPPQGGNWTPMAQSLDVAAELTELNDAATANHVLLITDGWQWCSPYDSATRFLPVNSVTNLTSLKVTTWVVGFGEGVDALALNKMAQAAATMVNVNCDVGSIDPKASNNCYYQANDPAGLLQALQNIAQKINNEVCDGLDNNCDGNIDESLTGPGCAKQAGVCAGATKSCGGTSGWQTCSRQDYESHATASGTIFENDETTCDGKDNDCDGTIDEGCDCSNGQSRPCGVNEGICVAGNQVCADGVWGACQGGVEPESKESCNGKDDDCNGSVDENLTRPCSNDCGNGTESCENGKWTGCTAPVVGDEICDGLDNDCDGTIDGPTAICAEGQECINGACQAIVVSGGCDCHLNDDDPAAALIPLSTLLLGLLLMLRRRG